MIFVRVSQKNSFKAFLEMEKKMKEELAKKAKGQTVTDENLPVPPEKPKASSKTT